MFWRSKPTNLKFLPLSAEDDRWTPWRCSDCFYPEMIPEPDYSDSGDETEADDEEEELSFPSSTRGTFESLRDMTEVYVTSVEQKKPAAKRSSPSPKTSPKGTAKAADKTAPGKSKTTDKIHASERKTSPKQSPKAPIKTTKAQQKSGVAKAKPDAAKKTPLLEESKSKAEAKNKKEEKKTKDKTSRKESPTDHRKTAKSSPEAVRKASPTSAAKANPVAKTKAAALKPKHDPEIAAGDAKTPPSGKKSKEIKSHTKTQLRKSPPSSHKSISPTSTPASTEPSSDEEQLIKPKKPINPYLQSSERQKLHKELKFSQKYGKLGGSQKTELELALQRYTENRERRELLAGEKSSLEQILELQARKIEMQEKMDKHPAWMERLQRPPSATWSDPRIDEFYRVHARVVSNNMLTHCFLPDDEECDFSSPKKLSSDSASDG